MVDAGINSHSGGAGAVTVIILGKSCNSSADSPHARNAPDSGFRYPAGYRIGQIVKNYLAG